MLYVNVEKRGIYRNLSFNPRDEDPRNFSSDPAQLKKKIPDQTLIRKKKIILKEVGINFINHYSKL